MASPSHSFPLAVLPVVMIGWKTLGIWLNPPLHTALYFYNLLEDSAVVILDIQ